MISNQRQTNQKLNAQSLILFCLEKDWVAIISNNAGIFHHNLSGNIQPSQLSLSKLQALNIMKNQITKTVKCNVYDLYNKIK